MIKDPIVEEVRAARAEMFRLAGGTREGLTALLRRKGKARMARIVVTNKPRKPVVFKSFA